MKKRFCEGLCRLLCAKVNVVESIFYGKLEDVRLAIRLDQISPFIHNLNLHVAVLLEKYEICQILLKEANLDPNVALTNRIDLLKMKNGRNFAISSAISDKLPQLEERGFETTPTTIAFLCGNYTILNLLLQNRGCLRAKYEQSLVRFCLKNMKTRNRNIVNLLAQNNEFRLSQAEHKEFSRTIEETWPRIKSKPGEKREFEECLEVLVDYGYEYKPSNQEILQQYEQDSRLKRILRIHSVSTPTLRIIEEIQNLPIENNKNSHNNNNSIRKNRSSSSSFSRRVKRSSSNISSEGVRRKPQARVNPRPPSAPSHRPSQPPQRRNNNNINDPSRSRAQSYDQHRYDVMEELARSGDPLGNGPRMRTYRRILMKRMLENYRIQSTNVVRNNRSENNQSECSSEESSVVLSESEEEGCRSPNEMFGEMFGESVGGNRRGRGRADSITDLSDEDGGYFTATY